MKDFVGNTIEIGDKVAYSQKNAEGALKIGTITGHFKNANDEDFYIVDDAMRIPSHHLVKIVCE